MSNNTIPEWLYLKKVNLNGYRTIRDVAITFQPGLNIIIGHNGTGKTNFMEFLDMLILIDAEKFQREVAFQLVFEKNGVLRKIEARYEIKKLKLSQFKLEAFDFFRNNKNEINLLKNHDKISYNKGNWQISFQDNSIVIPNSLLLKYNIPTDRSLLDTTLELDFSPTATGLALLLNEQSKKENTTALAQYFIKEVLLKLDELGTNISFKEFEIRKTVEQIIEQFDIEILNQALRKFTNIEAVKINVLPYDIAVHVYDSTSRRRNEPNIINIPHIDIRFLIENEWWSCEQLSDGTKRMFYIISEITYAPKNTIVLLEEPELGIHPHQFAKIMTFLKEASTEKQIILTTHAPQTLNFLDKEELDNIIITSIKQGQTKMRHLTDQEQKHALDYMEDNYLFLSDYWVHSDLEA